MMRDWLERNGWWATLVILVVAGSLGLRLLDRENEQRVESVKSILTIQSHDRADARKSSCIQENVQTQKNRTALIGGMTVLVSFASNPTPAQRQRIDAFLDAYTKQIKVLQPYRNCSRSGLDDYYRNPPPDPALTEGKP
jgi:hypothetical protein